MLEWSPPMAGRAKAGATRSSATQPSRRATATKAHGNGAAQPRRPRLSGPVVTDRDLEIIRWIGQHGMVTPRQVAVHFFSRPDKTVGTWAAYRRLRILEDMGLLQRDHTFWREPQVLRITNAATRFADLRPAMPTTTCALSPTGSGSPSRRSTSPAPTAIAITPNGASASRLATTSASK
jgi:hypothetical protein